MLLIKVKNIRLCTINTSMSAPAVLSQMFPLRCNIREGGNLNGTTFRIDENGSMWAKFTLPHKGETRGELEISINTNSCSSSESILEIRKVIRYIRNFCENKEYEDNTDRSSWPFIDGYEAGSEVHVDVIDELLKACTPTIGFSFRKYIINNPNEPFFVLLGRDLQAPALLEDWALTRRYSPEVSDKIKAAEALDIARSMRGYRIDNPEVGIRHAVLQTALETREKASSNHRTKDVATPVT